MDLIDINSLSEQEQDDLLSEVMYLVCDCYEKIDVHTDPDSKRKYVTIDGKHYLFPMNQGA